MLSIIEVVAIFICGYLCKSTKDYFELRRMERRFNAMSLKDKNEITKNVLNHLNGKE